MRVLPWREELRKARKPKERMSIERAPRNELDPAVRRTSMSLEVNTGLSREQAVVEASRCLDCPDAPCTEGCPAGVNIPSFIKNIERGEIMEAVKVIRRTSSLPAVCGRVCPQEKQCESRCTYLKTGRKAVSIGALERFAADYEIEHPEETPQIEIQSNGIKVVAVGSGPAGLSFAGDMAAAGYDVTVYEARKEFGGVLRYGIPEYRLPKHIVDREIDKLRKMGVKFVNECLVGKDISYNEFNSKAYAGVFLGSGAGRSRHMNIPGRKLGGICSWGGFLRDVNDREREISMQGLTVAVIGGGNTAMDASRSAMRLGAKKVYIVYRRSREEMPASVSEIREAEEEGIEILTLRNPLEYISDSKGKVKEVKLQLMQLGEPDESGRRSAVPIDGCVESLMVDDVIESIGSRPDNVITSSIEELKTDERGSILVDYSQRSTAGNIYAGGDVVRGAATVILAMGDGRRAAASMIERLNTTSAE